MIFKSYRTMDASVCDSIPQTTNAEEAMHWRFYSAAGRDHTFMHGFRALLAIAIQFERSYMAEKSMFMCMTCQILYF